MKPLNVVVAQSDAHYAERLAASLYNHFRSVSVARSSEELRDSIPKHRADLAIVDLELVNLDEVQDLRHKFQDTTIVCTHRVPDEEMWASALAAGASDICQSADVNKVVNSALRSLGVLAASQAA